MTIFKQINKETQLIARCEKSLAIEKLKQRRANTRRKIELGGLVIKANLHNYNKSIILGAFIYSFQLIQKEPNCLINFESIGASIFSNNPT